MPDLRIPKIILLTLFLTAVLSACTQKSEVPQTQTHPVDKITIYGTLPVDQGLDLRMTARFESKNNACGEFVDISHAYQLSKTIDIEVQKSGNSYEAHFFRDAIAKGKCDWSFIYASVQMLDKNGNVAWLKFYGATPKDMKQRHLQSVLHHEEDHLFKVSCHSLPKEATESKGNKSDGRGLKCVNRAVFLMPGIQKYHVDFDYSVR